MKRINMYIDHDRSVYRGLFRKRKRRRLASAILPFCLLFPPFHARWWVGHVLVLVFAAMRRHLALLVSPLEGKPAAMLLLFFGIRVCKSTVYGLISHDSIKTKQEST